MFFYLVMYTENTFTSTAHQHCCFPKTINCQFRRTCAAEFGLMPIILVSISDQLLESWNIGRLQIIYYGLHNWWNSLVLTTIAPFRELMRWSFGSGVSSLFLKSLIRKFQVSFFYQKYLFNHISSYICRTGAFNENASYCDHILIVR